MNKPVVRTARGIIHFWPKRIRMLPRSHWRKKVLEQHGFYGYPVIIHQED